MSGPTLRVRPPAVAGRFYQADSSRCGADARQLCAAPLEATIDSAVLHGGVVPHAGWVCSGRVAGLTFKTLRDRTEARTIILTGSVHTMAVNGPTLETAHAWSTPLGDVEVDAELREALAALPGFEPLDMAHQYEHSLEVQLPLIRTVFGEGVRFVPCLIPPHPDAARWGRMIGRLLADWPHPAVMIASSDLTHYGPNYRFTPQGVGEHGCRWAHEVNDRRLIDLMLRMEAEAIVAETARHLNACGGGAIAAAIACCAALGAGRGHLLDHTHSTRELTPLGCTDPNNSVGYAGIVFG